MIEGFQAEYLLADRGYDTDAIILQAMEQDMIPVIPSKKNRKQLREYDEYLYKIRHLVENAFLLLKRWRGPNPLYCHLVAHLLTTLSKENTLGKVGSERTVAAVPMRRTGGKNTFESHCFTLAKSENSLSLSSVMALPLLLYLHFLSCSILAISKFALRIFS